MRDSFCYINNDVLWTTTVCVRINCMRRTVIILIVFAIIAAVIVPVIQIRHQISLIQQEQESQERESSDQEIHGQGNSNIPSDLQMVSPAADIIAEGILGDYYYLDSGRIYRAYIETDRCIHLIYSDDVGASWNETFVSDTVAPDGKVFVCFVDENTGYLLYCSDPGAGQMDKILYRTEDGGNTFSVQEELSSMIDGYPTDLLFDVDGTGYITVKYHGTDEYFYRYDGQGGWSAVTVAIPTETYSYVNGTEIKTTEDGYRLEVEVVTPAGSESYYYSSTDGKVWSME